MDRHGHVRVREAREALGEERGLVHVAQGLLDVGVPEEADVPEGGQQVLSGPHGTAHDLAKRPLG